jgi:hypothetical protein
MRAIDRPGGGVRPTTLLAALPCYAAVVVWLTWPLATHLRTHLPDTWIACRFDLLQMTWALAYQTHALLTAPTTLADANIYHPAPHALFYGDPGFGALPWFLPTFVATGNPALASNLLFLGSIALTAWALHVVVARFTDSTAGGVVAAWTFLTTRWVLWTWGPAVPNYAVLVYLPFVIWLTATPRTDRRSLTALLALVILQGLTTIYVLVPMLLWLGLVAAARTARATTRRAGLGLGAVVASAAVVLAVANVGFWIVRRENPSIITQSPWYTTEQRSWTALPWGLLGPGGPTGVPLVVCVVIAAGAASALLRERGARRSPAWTHATFWTVLGVWLSLTPTVRWFDRPVTLSPFVLSSWLAVLRKPDRLGVVALLGLALLAGTAFAECARRVHARLGAWAPGALLLPVVFAMYFQYTRGTGTPAALGVAPLPAAYPIVATPTLPLRDALEQSRGPLLELPSTWKLAGHQRPLQTANASAMYRSIFHHHPILNGYDGYWPAGFPERMALADTLPDANALARLRADTGLALILVHADEIGSFERGMCLEYARAGVAVPDCRRDIGLADRAAWLALARDGGRDDLRLLAREGDELLFGVTEGVR